MTDLLPCPFCGEKAMTYMQGDGSIMVKCESPCGARLISHSTLLAVANWNRRTPAARTTNDDLIKKVEQACLDMRARAQYVEEGQATIRQQIEDLQRAFVRGRIDLQKVNETLDQLLKGESR